MSKRIKWTREEDDKLQRLVSEGHTWIDISRQFGERSLDQLKTHNDVLVHRCTRDASTKTKFTEDEDWMLLQGVASHGAEWSKIVLTEGLHGIHSRQQLANRWRTLAPLAMQSAGPEDLRGRLKELHAKSGKKSYGTSLGPDMKRRMDFLFSDAATSQSNVTSPTLTDKTDESESSAPGTPPSPAVYPYEVLRLTSKRSRSRSSSVPVAEPILPPELSQLFDIPAIQEAFKNPQTSASAHSVPNPNNATAFRAAWSNVGPFLGITATSGMELYDGRYLAALLVENGRFPDRDDIPNEPCELAQLLVA